MEKKIIANMARAEYFWAETIYLLAINDYVKSYLHLTPDKIITLEKTAGSIRLHVNKILKILEYNELPWGPEDSFIKLESLPVIRYLTALRMVEYNAECMLYRLNGVEITGIDKIEYKKIITGIKRILRVIDDIKTMGPGDDPVPIPKPTVPTPN